MAYAGLVFILIPIILCSYIVYTFLRFLNKAWWTPIRLQATMNSQGIKGPPYRYPHGNTKEISRMMSQSLNKPMEISHDIYQRIQPHVYTWSKVYGRNFLNWHGSDCQLFITEPEIAKEILMNRDGAFPKMDMNTYMKKLLGESLISNEGEKWWTVRKLANHIFHSEGLKKMVPEISSSVAAMLENWKVYEGKEIDVFKELKLLMTEVISRTAFGSSYLEGKEIFEIVAQLTNLISRNANVVRVPGISLVMKSKDEVEAEKLEQKFKSRVLELVKKREERVRDGELEDFGSDFLGQLLKVCREPDVKKRITTNQMVDEIKAVYGAGHVTASSFLGWCAVVLAIHTDWQDRAREEVTDVFGGNNPDSDGLARLKIMNMIINETLRLYPVGLLVPRKVVKEVVVGGLRIPPKMNIIISILALHHDPEIWGEDVHLFRPERFAEGVSRATNNNAGAFIPFGLGARNCVGSNFTVNEAKIALSMILQKYKLVISPNYVHYPTDAFILLPKNGVQVILHKV